MTVCVRVQQQAIALETAQHVACCLASSSVPVQLSACKVLKHIADSSNALQHAPHIARKLVKLNERQDPLSTAPAIECTAILCNQSNENAAAVVGANGMHALLRTLEDDRPAQVQPPQTNEYIC